MGNHKFQPNADTDPNLVKAYYDVQLAEAAAKAAAKAAASKPRKGKR